MAAQTDSKDRAQPLYGKIFLELLPQIRDLGFPKIFRHIPRLTVFNTPPSYIARKKAQVMTDYTGIHQKKSRIESEE